MSGRTGHLPYGLALLSIVPLTLIGWDGRPMVLGLSMLWHVRKNGLGELVNGGSPQRLLESWHQLRSLNVHTW